MKKFFAILLALTLVLSTSQVFAFEGSTGPASILHLEEMTLNGSYQGFSSDIFGLLGSEDAWIVIEVIADGASIYGRWIDFHNSAIAVWESFNVDVTGVNELTFIIYGYESTIFWADSSLY